MFVRRCSDAAQQHQREQRDERMWMPHPIVSQARRNGGNFGRTRVESVCVRKHGIPPGPPAFDFPASNTMPAREGPEKRQSRSSAGFVIRGGAFSDLRKGHQRSFEDPKTHQVAQWRWRFFGSRGKKTVGRSVLNAFPPSDGLRECRKCGSAAAASSGFACVQDRAATW